MEAILSKDLCISKFVWMWLSWKSPPFFHCHSQGASSGYYVHRGFKLSSEELCSICGKSCSPLPYIHILHKWRQQLLLSCDFQVVTEKGIHLPAPPFAVLTQFINLMPEMSFMTRNDYFHLNPRPIKHENKVHLQSLLGREDIGFI